MKTECFLRCLNIIINLFVLSALNKSFHFSTPEWTMLEFLWYWLGSTVIKSDSHLLLLTLPMIQITSLCFFSSTRACICHRNPLPLHKRIVNPEIKSVFIIYWPMMLFKLYFYFYHETQKEMLDRMSNHKIKVDGNIYFKAPKNTIKGSRCPNFVTFHATISCVTNINQWHVVSMITITDFKASNF